MGAGGLTRPKQLSMAATAGVIWLNACVRYWPDPVLVFECVTCFLLLSGSSLVWCWTAEKGLQSGRLNSSPVRCKGEDVPSNEAARRAGGIVEVARGFKAKQQLGAKVKAFENFPSPLTSYTLKNNEQTYFMDELNGIWTVGSNCPKYG